MNAKEYLEQLRKFYSVVEQYKLELKNLHSQAFCIGSFDYSKDKVSGSGTSKGAKFEHYSDKAVDLETDINKIINEYMKKRIDIIKQIQRLNKVDYIDVLYKKYAEFKELKEIACEMKLSYAHIKRLHRKALEEFEKIYCAA